MSKEIQQAEQVNNLMSTLAKMQKTASKQKGSGAQRLEALAMTIAALNIDGADLRSVEIDWKVDGSMSDKELLPVFKAVFWSAGTKT